MFSDLRQQLNFAFWSCWAVLSFHADLCNHITQPVQTETNEIGALYLRFSPGNFNFSSPGNEWLEFDKANMFPCLEHLGHLAHARCAPSNPPPPNKNHGKQMAGNCLVVPVALHPKCPHPVNLRDLNVGQWLVALFGWLVGCLVGRLVGCVGWFACWWFTSLGNQVVMEPQIQRTSWDSQKNAQRTAAGVLHYQRYENLTISCLDRVENPPTWRGKHTTHNQPFMFIYNI